MGHENASEACIKPAMQFIPVAMVLLSGNSLLIEEINQAGLELLQVDRRVIGKKIGDVIPQFAERFILNRESDVFLEVNDTTIPVRLSYQSFEDEGILVAITEVSGNFYQVKADPDDFATSVIESAGLGTFEFDVTRKRFRSSKRFAEIFGFPHPVPFMEYMKHVHPGDYYLRQSARQDINEGRSLLYEVRLLMPDKSTKCVRINAKAFFDEQHKKHRWIGSVQDITNERRAYQKLQESEAKFRTLITETPEVAAALYTGPEIRIQFVNPAMLNYWGKDESVIGKTFMEALPETSGQPFYDQLRQVYSTGVTFSAKDQRAVLEINGLPTVRYYNYTYKALRSPSGAIYGIHHMAVDVTDEVSAKQQLIQSEDSVRQLFMQTPVGIGVLRGRSLIIELVNDAMLAYWKRTREEVLGKPLWEIFPEVASQGLNEVTEKIFTTHEPYFSPETPIEMMRNGKLERVYISFAFEPLIDNDGTVTGLLSIGNEVTDLVVAKQRSELNEARLQHLADSMPQLVWIADENGKVTYYNNQFKKYEGVRKKDDGTWEWNTTLHPDDFQRTRRAWQAAVTKKINYEIEHRIKMHDGTFRWHLSRAYPQFDHEGKTIWYGTGTDIQQVKDAEVAIRESEERFRIMADATPTIIWALTPEGYHRYLNKFAIDYLGLALEKVQDMNWDVFIHPDDLEEVKVVLEDTLQNKVPYRMEHRLRRHDGQYRWFLAQGGPSYYSDGTLYGFVGSGTDIHEWKLAQEMLRKNEEMLENLVKERTLELQRSNDDLQQFAHVASHDLKEPIRKIKTFSYKLQEEYSHVLNDRGNTLLNKIINSSDRMFAMINGVLSYSAVASVKESVEHVDLNKVVDDVKNDLELLITEKNATIDYGDLPTVYANADLIHQLFYNLLNNSLKFSRMNQPSQIRIKCRSITIGTTPYVEVSITDNGIGFDNQHAEQIFGSFVRLHSKDEFEGSGLGLALCKRIVERYGGTIAADGNKAAGSIFRFSLPT